jgi:uncharacterized delta-60 repeat protein
MKQLTSMLTLLFLCTYVNAQVGGGLDVSFNTSGYAINPQSVTGDDFGNSIAVQNDGKVLAAVVVPEEWFKIIRYKLDGTPDGSFGSGGVVTIRQNPIKTAQSYAIALQSDGKIIVGGNTWTDDNNDFALVRLKTDGVVDSSFGTNGWVYTPVSPITVYPFGDDKISKIVVLPDNSIIAAGHAYNGIDDDFALAKYDANGVLVTSFGTNGKINLDVNNDDYVTGLGVTSTGNIVVAGNSNTSTNTDITVAQFTAAGVIDPGFNSGSVLTTGITGNYEVHGLAIQSNDYIVITGLTPPNSAKDVYVARIKPDGTFDTNFGGTGQLWINYASGISNDEGRSVTVQSDGKIIIAGITDAVTPPSQYDVLLIRLNADGSFDTNFDADGKAITSISAVSDYVFNVALYGPRIYVTGATHYTGTSTMDFYLAAFTNDFNTLPIVLSDFYAQKLTSAVSLKWQTASEENVKRFVIERSSDGVTYKSIGQVTAVGNSTTKQSYIYTDNSPLMPATNFYRLLMQDADGNAKYSKILTVKFTGELTLNMQLSPNPTSNTLQVQLPDGLKGTVSLQVFDLNGRVVKTQNLASDGHALSTSIDVTGLQNGVYILKAQGGSTSLTSRFIKK